MANVDDAFASYISCERYKSVICLSGELPSEQFFTMASAKGLPIIAADGSLNELHDVLPDLVIGDLDSISLDMRRKARLLHLSSQDESDFEKALSYIRDSGLAPSIIVGANGGCIDHVLNNISIFARGCISSGVNGGVGHVLYAPPIVVHVMTSGGRLALDLPISSKLSLMGAHKAVVTTKGLKWELSSVELCYPHTSSCFNRSATPSPEIFVEEGSLLVFVYLQPVGDSGSDYIR